MKNPTLFAVMLWLGVAEIAIAQPERYTRAAYPTFAPM